MLRFKRMLKRKVYPTWVSQRVGNCKVYIFEVPTENSYFHFQVVCYDDIQYASLAHNEKFNCFNDACQRAAQWLYNNKIIVNKS